MFELVKKIQAIIDAYHANNEQLAKEIKRIIEEWSAEVNTYAMDYIKQQISKEVTAARESSEKQNKTYNQELNNILDKAKKTVLPELYTKATKPSDYSRQISNAIEYLKIKGQDITDESAYMILKDFIDDFDQMKLFKDIIETLIKPVNPIGLIDANGKTTFPLTFGKLNKIETILNSFNDMDAIANMLFIHPREEGEMYIVNGQAYSISHDSLKQMEGEESIIGFAKIIEKYAKKIPGIKQVTDQTEHETVEN